MIPDAQPFAVMTTATVSDPGDIRVEVIMPGFRVWVGTEYCTANPTMDLDGNDEPYATLEYMCGLVRRGIVRARKGEWVDQWDKRTQPAKVAEKAKVC